MSDDDLSPDSYMEAKTDLMSLTQHYKVNLLLGLYKCNCINIFLSRRLVR